jgi:hypothetical protein
MAGSSTDALLTMLDRAATIAFSDACRQFEADTRSAALPRDEGRLAEGIKVTTTSFGGTAGGSYTAEVVSTAKGDGGADYPQILNDLPRIAPTRAKYLRFVVHGQTVFSKGFTNRHKGWWAKQVSGQAGQARWTKALNAAFRSWSATTSVSRVTTAQLHAADEAV